MLINFLQWMPSTIQFMGSSNIQSFISYQNTKVYDDLGKGFNQC
jgi:hypothetical protein